MSTLSLDDQVTIRLTKIREEHLIVPSQERGQEPSLGWADSYLKKLFTLMQMLEKECNLLASAAQVCEGEILAFEHDVKILAASTVKIAQIRKMLSDTEFLLEYVEQKFEHEAMWRNEALRRRTFTVNSDWSFTADVVPDLPGSEPDAPKRKRLRVPRAADGESTLH